MGTMVNSEPTWTFPASHLQPPHIAPGTLKVVKRIVLAEGKAPAPKRPPTGRLPRITRYMALAIYYEELIREGQVHDYAEIAALGHVTRARVTQIMNLRLLAPDIQEEILSLE